MIKVDIIIRGITHSPVHAIELVHKLMPTVYVNQVSSPIAHKGEYKITTKHIVLKTSMLLDDLNDDCMRLNIKEIISAHPTLSVNIVYRSDTNYNAEGTQNDQE